MYNVFPVPANIALITKIVQIVVATSHLTFVGTKSRGNVEFRLFPAEGGGYHQRLFKGKQKSHKKIRVEMVLNSIPFFKM